MSIQLLFAGSEMDQQFCYWDAKSFQDATILIVFFVIEMGIGILTVMRLKKTSRLGEQGKKIILIYILIMVWATIICSQQLYSIFVYFNYLKDDPKLVTYYSTNFVRFDILPGFTVQTIFIVICRFYYQGLMGAIQISHLMKWERKFIDYLNIYLFFRLMAQAIGITLVNIYAQTQQISLFSSINIWILISDSVITNVFLGLSLKIYLKGLNHIISLQNEQITKLKIQYSIMIISSFFRVAIDILFLTALPIIIEPSSNACMGPFQSHLIQSIFYLIIGNTVNHIIPIAWILKIYTFEQDDALKRSTLTNLLTTSQEE